MKPAQFVKAAKTLLGEDDAVWRKRFCDITGYNPSTVTRMVSGEIPVTEVVASLFYCFELMAHKDTIDYLKEFELDG